jgi:hypothetical protein
VKTIKITLAMVFITGIIIALMTPALAFPPFVSKARKFGAKDCRFCHVNAEGGSPNNARGNWLIKEKERRNADAVDPEWLVGYKPAKKKK